MNWAGFTLHQYFYTYFIQGKCNLFPQELIFEAWKPLPRMTPKPRSLFSTVLRWPPLSGGLVGVSEFFSICWIFWRFIMRLYVRCRPYMRIPFWNAEKKLLSLKLFLTSSHGTPYVYLYILAQKWRLFFLDFHQTFPYITILSIVII